MYDRAALAVLTAVLFGASPALAEPTSGTDLDAVPEAMIDAALDSVPEVTIDVTLDSAPRATMDATTDATIDTSSVAPDLAGPDSVQPSVLSGLGAVFAGLVVPGTGFDGPGHFRIAFCVTDNTIKNSLEGFKRAIQRYH